jgi:hypothetical protein
MRRPAVPQARQNPRCQASAATRHTSAEAKAGPVGPLRKQPEFRHEQGSRNRLRSRTCAATPARVDPPAGAGRSGPPHQSSDRTCGVRLAADRCHTLLSEAERELASAARPRAALLPSRTSSTLAMALRSSRHCRSWDKRRSTPLTTASSHDAREADERFGEVSCVGRRRRGDLGDDVWRSRPVRCGRLTACLGGRDDSRSSCRRGSPPPIVTPRSAPRDPPRGRRFAVVALARPRSAALRRSPRHGRTARSRAAPCRYRQQ